MDETEGDRGRRVLGRFPRIHVRSRRDMARLLRKYRWLLDQIAARQLGATPEAGEAVNSVVARMLAMDQPDIPHALRTVTQSLHYECSQLKRARDRPASAAEISRAKGIPYDDVYGPVVDALAEAAKCLPPAERQAFWLAAKGVRVADIAAALNVKPRTITMRLYRARKSLRPYARKNQALLGPLLVSGFRRAWRWMGDRSAVARQGPTRWLAPVESATSVAPQFTNATALASLLVWALGSVGPPPIDREPVTRPAVAAVTTPAPVEDPVASSPPASDEGARRHTTAPVGVELPSLGHPRPSARTPADTHLVAAAPAPNYQANHTIVALGEDPSCGCLVLFQSANGGDQWAVAPGPPGGTQLALPPTYPVDPRIFIGNTSSLTGASDYWTGRFGGAFAPLPGLSGLIGLSGGFDNGDPEVYVATTAGVSSLDVTTGVASPVILSTGMWGIADLASQPSSSGVLAVVPPGSVVADAAALGANQAFSTGLFGCRAIRCSRVADTSTAQAGTLVISSTYASDQTMAVYESGHLVVSTDGGVTFAAMHLPSGTLPIWSVAVADGRVWVAGGSTRAPMLDWASATGGLWHAAAMPDQVPRVVGQLVAVGADRLLYLALGEGFRCTVDLGRSWNTSCPPVSG